MSADSIVAAGTLRMIGGSLSLANGSRADTLVMSAGTLGGPADLQVTHSLAWSGGTMGTGGQTTVTSEATGTISGSPTLAGRTLVNRGALSMGSGSIAGSGGAQLVNWGSFVDNSEGSASLSVVSPSPGPSFVNRGVVRKTAGAGTTTIGWGYYDLASTTALTGQFAFSAGRTTLGEAATDNRGPANAATPGIQRSCMGKPVDCATGNQFEAQTDLAVGGRGLGLDQTRVYNSQAAATASSSGAFGYGWSGSYSDRLVVDATNHLATVYQADGSTARFAIVGSSDFQAPAWVQATLGANADGSYSYTLPSQVVYRFDAAGRLISETDRNANATTMSYTSGRLTSVSDPAGRSLSYTYNTDGTVASITDPTGLTANYAYAGGTLTSVRYTGVTDARWEFGYDAWHQLTSMTDARGHTTTTAYDASRRVVSQTDALNRTRAWSYAANATTITNPGGDVTHEVFDNGEPVQITRAHGTSRQATQTLTYNANRALSASTDASGRTTTYGYDAAGNRSSVTSPGARTTTSTYNTTRDVTSTTTPAGKTTSFAYDAHGNLTSVARTLTVAGHPDVTQTSTFGYDTAGNETSATDPLGHTTTFEYDTRGNMTGRSDPLGHTTSWSYDDGSRVASLTSPRGHQNGADLQDFTTTIQRDMLGRAIGSTDGSGRHTSSVYDALGNVVSQSDAEGRTTTAVYDAENQPTSTTSPGSATSHTSYDANGQVAAVTDPNGHVTTYTRDALARVVSVSDPLSHQTAFAYDLSGRMTSQTNAAAKTTTYAYSPAGELTSIDYEDPATHDVTYSYDGDGQRTSMTDATGQTTFSYDTLGRLTSTTDADNHTIAYSYDLADRQTSLTYPGGDTVSRAYDTADRLTSISDWLGNTTGYAYDADDNQTTVTYPTSTKDVEQLAYDHAGQAVSQTIAHDATNRAAVAYAYNATDQLTSQTDTGDLTASHSYDYNTDGRLSADGTDTVGYDDAGNLTSRRAASLSYDAADRLTSSTHTGDITAFAYNATGDRTQTTPTGPTADYAYDQADQLTNIDDHTATPISYTYAADGLRATKTKNAQTTHYTWDRTSSIPVLLAKDSTRYVYDIDGLPLEQIDNDNTISYLHHDRLGSTRLVTNADGSTQATYSYDAYGNRTTTAGSSSVPFGYTGQYTDTDTSLIYLRHRYYDPTTGQFLTRDPLEALTHDAYGYADNDPVNGWDPTGLLTILGHHVTAGDLSAATGTLALLPTPLSPALGLISVASGVVSAKHALSEGDYLGAGLDFAAAGTGATSLVKHFLATRAASKITALLAPRDAAATAGMLSEWSGLAESVARRRTGLKGLESGEYRYSMGAAGIADASTLRGILCEPAPEVA